ncbi:MAG: hypothetical protein ABIZ49_02450 [Opitutaceae bacterium]
MKPSTLLIAVSLAANAALAAVFVLKPALAPPALRDFFARGSAPATSPTSSTLPSPASRPSPVSADVWASLQTDDPKTLIARLRAAGFSPAIIRAILEAQIEKNFAARMKALVGSPEDTPFWKPDPTSGINNMKFYDEYSRIYRERSQLLRQLLGDDFLAGTGVDPTAAQRRQYGDLPKTKIDLIERVVADYADMTAQVRSAMQGVTLPEDREKMALLEREKRADLAAILSPQELEDYEMRSSTTSMRLRQAMTFMDASEDEFRSIYRIQQQFADQINPVGGLITADMMQQRTAATLKAAEQIKAALGDQRFAEYTRASNNEFQQLTRLAQRENIPSDVALRTFNLRDTVAQESNRIAADTSLDPAQKRAALQSLVQTTKAQIIGSLGQTAGNGYIQTANYWLSSVERGSVVTFGLDGMPTYKPVAPPPGGAGGRGGAAGVIDVSSGFILRQ